MKSALEKNSEGRGRLVEATLACLADVGVEKTSVRRIAERAGVTPGLIRHYFGTKDQLLVESYLSVNQRTLARLSMTQQTVSQSIEETLAFSIEAFFPSGQQGLREMKITMAFWGLVLSNPEIAQIQKEANDTYVNFFANIIKGHVESKSDAVEIANGIVAISDGLWLECCLNPKRLKPKHAIGIAVRFSVARLKYER